MWGVPKIKAAIRIIRVTVFPGQYWGPSGYGTYHICNEAASIAQDVRLGRSGSHPRQEIAGFQGVRKNLRLKS